MRLPEDHPGRRLLNDEIHARPPEALTAPLRLSFLALHGQPGAPSRQFEHVADLARRFGVAPPAPGVNHFSCDLGPLRVKWENHTEFARYKFIVEGEDGGADGAFERPAISEVPRDWLDSLTGTTIVAANVALVRDTGEPIDAEAISARHFGGNVLTGGRISGGAATAFTDFRIHADGFSRFYVADQGLTPRQAGRTLQRLLEIDTYRMMALLALPAARELGAALGHAETELARIAHSLAQGQRETEADLLEALTQLEAEIESRYAGKLFRFAASAAYYALVRRRISELREERIPGIQTIEEFLERRLTPAMSTCEAVTTRQEALAGRVSRVSQLLATRVEVVREGQSQALLASMDRRAKLQLRLQETVEGLSVAAVTYYVVGLVGYGAEGLKSLGLHVDSGLLKGMSIPVVALLMWLGVRRVRRSVEEAE
ncbi:MULTISPECIES: DUF3422 family protein [unclassified Aureimonas]|uniref:DUF3422 family protein n=1 Tax=unclassified Aureimonas TaxID=2615206 RepID=UPI0006FCEE76|nr:MULTISPECIES: DUF3422 domain-containing protein [unclassified Aureimonas]KQT64433.1 hypothetical protein ASG62_05605 [Aureimonas sp. Leaf427]KQT81622.1 hypothetical protein ASG54_02885 [Aureimonas sp. Leaf460]